MAQQPILYVVSVVQAFKFYGDPSNFLDPISLHCVPVYAHFRSKVWGQYDFYFWKK